MNNLITPLDVEKIGDSIPSADAHNIATFNSFTTAPCGCGMQLDYWRSGATAKRVRVIVKHNVDCAEKIYPGTRDVDGIYTS